MSSTKHALITGASAGIGAEFARQLHQRGYRVTLVARRKELLEQFCSDANAQRSGSALALAADLTSEEDIRVLENFVRDSHIDLLVNNAGRGSFGRFEEIPIGQEIELLMLNINATVRLAHAVIPQMKLRRSGGIVSLSSIAGFQSIPYLSTYAATKAFNLHHSLALREELREFGVRVLVVCPGPTATEFGGAARVPGGMTGISRDTVELVVRQSLDAYQRDVGLVVPGWRSWGLSVGSRWLPRLLSARLAKHMLSSALKSRLRGQA